jgi:hypothetical protein
MALTSRCRIGREVCAAVLYYAVVSQNKRTLPTRLNLGNETLPLVHTDIYKSFKEIDEWEKEMAKVASRNDDTGLLDILQR